jgi:putative transposase
MNDHSKDIPWFTAAFRWDAIAPYVAAGATDEERRQYLRDVFKREFFDPVRGPRRLRPGTFKRWVRAWQKDGMRGLLPKPRKDKGALRAFPPEVLTRAIELRRESPRRSVKRLVELLGQDFPHLRDSLARGTLDRHLRLQGWSRAALRTTAGPHIPFEMPHRNAMWTGDVLHGPNVLVDGELVRAKVFGWIDDYSRLCVHLEAYPDERLPALEDALRKAMDKHGVPDRLFCDNACIFSSNMLALACGMLGITLVHSTPGYAPSRGKIERFFRTVRDELLCEVEALDPMSLEEFNTYLRSWVETVYHTRAHSRTGQTPRQRWEADEQPPLRSVSAYQLEQAFLQWARRKVGTTGEIKLEGNIYYADPTLAHQTVIVRYDPFDLSAIWLWREGQPMLRVTADRLVTRQLRRDHKRVARRRPTAAQKFLTTLSDKHQLQLAREMRLIRFSDAPKSKEE